MSSRQQGPQDQQARRLAAEELWLSYFNQSLYAQGLITERERNLMSVQIRRRAGKQPGSSFSSG